MKALIQLGVTGFFITVVAIGILSVASRDDPENKPMPLPNEKLVAEGRARLAARSLAARPAAPFGDGYFNDGGNDIAIRYSQNVRDTSSLASMSEERRARGGRGIATVRQQLALLAPHHERRLQFEIWLALLQMYDGEFENAIKTLDEIAGQPEIQSDLHANIIALRGVAQLRRGEVDNSINGDGPASWVFPIAREGIQKQTEGSRAAVRDFTEYLSIRPEDFGVRWLLNITEMTLGGYPDKVPPAFLIPLDSFRSKHDPGQFANITRIAGVGSRGLNMLGGCSFDDFTGDGLPDIFVGSIDCDLGASLFVNRGDGTFEDRGAAAGLTEQTLVSNVQHADFDNDGRLDILVLRGGWETPCRLSLLRNTGGKFDDVTEASGLSRLIASHTAAWGDYDNDGLVDLYVGGEFSPIWQEYVNHGRLYHNEGGGKFVDVGEQAGVLNHRWAKGATWGDYDDDGDIDLYISNILGPNRLYCNQGNGTFTDVAERAGLSNRVDTFSCWFWDYDNDGRLDIFAAGFDATLNTYAKSRFGQTAKAERLHLYRNVGTEGFRDVTREVGLDQVIMSAGSNFADINNDGYLDFYVGTGGPAYSALVPNVMFQNLEGVRFEDVTLASRTGHLQKGNGISFADWDGDGDLDLFVQLGGFAPGDRAHNALFQNPGHGKHWLALKLNGTKTNRAAIGARVRVDFRDARSQARSVYRVVGSGSSYGGNSLVVHIGLDVAAKADLVTVTWPASKSTQVFRDVQADQAVDITEGSESYRKLPARRLSVPNGRP